VLHTGVGELDVANPIQLQIKIPISVPTRTRFWGVWYTGVGEGVANPIQLLIPNRHPEGFENFS
jgi:hypothetical protein